MLEIKTGSRKDNMQLPFKIFSENIFFLTYLSNLRGDKLPVFVFLKKLFVQHRLSKIADESPPSFQAVTATAI